MGSTGLNAGSSELREVVGGVSAVELDCERELE